MQVRVHEFWVLNTPEEATEKEALLFAQTPYLTPTRPRSRVLWEPGRLHISVAARIRRWGTYLCILFCLVSVRRMHWFKAAYVLSGHDFHVFGLTRGVAPTLPSDHGMPGSIKVRTLMVSQNYIPLSFSFKKKCFGLGNTLEN